MATIVLPDRWRRKPPTFLPVDRAHSLARGLLVFADFRAGLARELVSGISLISTGTILEAMDSKFPNPASEIDSTDQFQFTGNVPYIPRSISVVWRGRVTNFNDYRTVLSHWSGTTESSNPDVFFNITTGTLRFVRGNAAESQAADWSTDAAPSTGVMFTVGITQAVRIQNTPQIWFDRAEQTSNDAGVGNGDAADPTQSVDFTRRSDGLTQHLGSVSHVMLFNRVLREEEYFALEENPWQILQARQRRVYLPGFVAGPTETILTAEQGTYAKTGQNVLFNLGFSTNQGVYTDTGQSANLATAIIAAQGSYVYAGQDAALRATFSILAEQGTYSYTGQAAVLDQKLALTQGSYVYAGQDARFDLDLLISQGVYTLSGQDATLIAQQVVTITAEQGSYVLSGQAAFFELDLVANQGTYLLSGQDARFEVRFLANQGTYSLAGQDADLIAAQNVILEAEQGIYTLAGQDARLAIITRPVVSVLGDDYPWPEKDHYRKRQWERELEAKRRLRAQLIDAVESLEARGETQGPQAKEALKTLRQARKRFSEPSGLLDFERMAVDLQIIRRLLIEYAGLRYAQAAIQAYEAQIDAAQQLFISDEEALQAYEAWEREHVGIAFDMVGKFSELLDAATIRAGRDRTH